MSGGGLETVREDDRMDVTDEMVRAAWVKAWSLGVQSVYVARVADHPDLHDLQAADREAAAMNDQVMREVIAAALSAAIRS